MGSESMRTTPTAAPTHEPASAGMGRSTDGAGGLHAEAIASSDRQRALGERIRGLRSGASAEVVQRQVMVQGQEASFQNIHDENGNPFLRTKTEDGTGKIWKVRPDADIETSVEESKDGYHVDYNDETRDKVHKNLSLGRHMELKTGDMKFTMLPFKSYLFKKSSEFEIAQWNEGEERAPLYTHHATELKELLKAEAGLAEAKGMEREELNKHLAVQFRQLAAHVLPTIIAEQQRFIGWTKQGQPKDHVKQFQKLVEVAAGQIADGNPIGSAVALVTTQLPWAGSKGKSNEIAKMKKDGHSHKPTVSASSFGSTGSPFAASSSSKVTPHLKEKLPPPLPLSMPMQMPMPMPSQHIGDNSGTLETVNEQELEDQADPVERVEPIKTAKSQPSSMSASSIGGSSDTKTLDVAKLKTDPTTGRSYVNHRATKDEINAMEARPPSFNVGGQTYELETPIARGGSNWYRLYLSPSEASD